MYKFEEKYTDCLKVISNFATTKEGGKWVIESDAFFIQHTGKLNSSTMELGKELKVEFPWNLKIGDIPKGDETKSLKFAHFFSLTNARPRTPEQFCRNVEHEARKSYSKLVFKRMKSSK